jgi:hypothetical protein
MKIQEFVVSYYEYLHACIVNFCHQSTEPVFNRLLLHFVIAMHAHAAQKLLQVGEQVTVTCSQVQTVGRMEKKSQVKSASRARVLAVFTFWTTLVDATSMYNGESTIILPAYNVFCRRLVGS